MKKVVLVLVVLAGAFTPVRAEAAKQPPPSCGSTVTSDLRLTQDMACEQVPALRVKPGVTIDLNGHSISIVQAQTCTPVILCGAITGMDSSLPTPRSAPITVKNGTVSGAGVVAHAHIDRVRFDKARVTSLWGGRVTRSRFNSSDLLVFANAVIDHNRFTSTSIFVDASLWGYGPGFAITNNRIEQGRIRMSMMYGPGALAGDVTGNRIRNSPGDGLAMTFDTNAVVDLQIADNVVRYSRDNGISVTRSPLMSGNGGPYVTIAGNVTNRNQNAGIVVETNAAPATVLDGGGNVARNNGSPCVGIVCAPDSIASR